MHGTHENTAVAVFVEDCEPSNDGFVHMEVIKTLVPSVPSLQWSGLPAEVHYIDGLGVQRIIKSDETEGGLQRALPIGIRPSQATTAQLIPNENDSVVACSEPIQLVTDVLKSDSHIIVIWSYKGQINAYSADESHDNHLELNLPLGYAFTFWIYLLWEQIDSFPIMD